MARWQDGDQRVSVGRFAGVRLVGALTMLSATTASDERNSTRRTDRSVSLAAAA